MEGNDTSKSMGRRPGSRLLINAAAFVVVVAGLRAASSVVVLFLVAAFFAMITAPGVLWLKKKRVPSGLAVLIVATGVIAILSVVGVMVGTSVNGFVRAVPGYRARLNESMAGLSDWAVEHGMDEVISTQLGSIDAGAVMGLAGDAFTALGGVLGNSFIIIITLLFILFEVSSFPVKLRAAFGVGDRSTQWVREITGNVARYVALKTVVSLVTGVGVGLWVGLAGLDFPLLWGLLAFLLNYIPTVGSLIAAVPAVLLALVQLGPTGAAIVALGFIIVNIVMGNVIEPRMMGEGLGLSPLVVVLSLLAWGWVLGTVGMFLAVPLTVSLRIVLESSEDTRWIAVLLGPAREAAAEPAAERTV